MCGLDVSSRFVQSGRGLHSVNPPPVLFDDVLPDTFSATNITSVSRCVRSVQQIMTSQIGSSGKGSGTQLASSGQFLPVPPKPINILEKNQIFIFVSFLLLHSSIPQNITGYINLKRNIFFQKFSLTLAY